MRVAAEPLVARLQAADEAAITEAFGRVFDNEVGAFVLAQILADAGVGKIRPDDLPGRARAYWDGQAALALNISGRARLGAEAVAVYLLNDEPTVRGRTHERDAFGGPDPEPAEFLG